MSFLWQLNFVNKVVYCHWKRNIFGKKILNCSSVKMYTYIIYIYIYNIYIHIYLVHITPVLFLDHRLHQESYRVALQPGRNELYVPVDSEWFRRSGVQGVPVHVPGPLRREGHRYTGAGRCPHYGHKGAGKWMSSRARC